MVRHVLNGRQLIVVREQCGTALVGQSAHHFGPAGITLHTGVSTGTVNHTVKYYVSCGHGRLLAPRVSVYSRAGLG
ncbi:Uncharacterised protein [Mycobacteroides abscessus subsp. abscessus]|nr:Uncharacterised protein [Mycobacteroides abscessus subsp. abscessus]